MGNCRDCRHWGKIRQEEHGVCCWLSVPRSGPAHEAPNAETLAVLDPADAYIEVEFLTMPDFGCVLFEAEA